MSGSDESVGARALATSKELLDAIVGRNHVKLTRDPALGKVVRSKLNVIVESFRFDRDIEKLKPEIDQLYKEMFPGSWKIEEDKRKTKEDNKARRAEGKARRAEARAKAEAEAKPEAEVEANPINE